MSLPEQPDHFLKNSEVIFPAELIQCQLERLASEITNDMAEELPVILPVMNGAIVMTGKLLPLLDFPLELDYLHASRYSGELTGSSVSWRSKPLIDVTDRTVLVIDDILDEGITAHQIMLWLKEAGAAIVKICVLLNKKINREKPICADYIGFDVPNEYVFGFGMDIKNAWRNLPDIRIYRGIG